MDVESPAALPTSKPEIVLVPSRSRADLGASLLCMLVGFVLATAPHWTNLINRGTLNYLSDGDDILYLAIARIPYHGENGVRDPFARQDEHVPSLYSWMQFVPLSKLTHWLGLPPLLIPLVWRSVGGILFGGSLYLLFRRLLARIRHPVAWSLACAVICLTDGGFIGGRMLVHNLSLVPELAAGIARGKPDGLPQYRVVTPLLNLPFVLIVVATLLPRAPRRPRDFCLGALCIGLCVHLYFFFWTALVVAMFGYLMVLTLRLLQSRQKSESRSEIKFAGLVLATGLLLGSGQILSNSKTFADPAYKPTLERMCRGRHITAGHPLRSQYLVNTWAWGKLAIGAVAICGLGFEGFGLLWWLTFAGYALANSAIVTGLEFENYHWNIVQAASGEVMVLGVAAMLFDRFCNISKFDVRTLWLIPALPLSIALIWRPLEALSAREPVRYTQVLKELQGLAQQLQSLHTDDVLAGPYETNLALLMSRAGQLYQDPHSSHSSAIADQEVHERFALNAWLSRTSREELVIKSREGMFENGFVYPTTAWNADAVAARRLAIFLEIEKSAGQPLLDRYRPTTVLAPTGSPAPPGGPWRKLGATNQWTLWHHGPDESRLNNSL